MLVKPWGVVILTLFGLLSFLSLLVSVVLMGIAEHRMHAAYVVTQRATFLVDSIANAGYVPTPRDTLRRRIIR
jgi:hypothetical protein